MISIRSLGQQLSDVRRVPAGGPALLHVAVPEAGCPQPRLLLIDKPDATQTYFYIGQPGDRTHESGPGSTAVGEHAVRRPVHLDAQ